MNRRTFLRGLLATTAIGLVSTVDYGKSSEGSTYNSGWMPGDIRGDYLTAMGPIRVMLDDPSGFYLFDGDQWVFTTEATLVMIIWHT